MMPTEEGAMVDARRRRRESIIAAAKGLFTRYGYRKTSMEEVARAARVTKPTIYAYFPSKEDLMLEVIRSEVERIFTGALELNTDIEDPLERYKRMFIMTDEYLNRDPFLNGIVRRDPEIVTPRFIDLAREMEMAVMRFLAAQLKQDMERGKVRNYNPLLLAYVLVKIHESFSFMPFYPEAEFTDEEIADFLDDFISAVLRPEKQ
jgi:AcrR family transcriptional regulator